MKKKLVTMMLCGVLMLSAGTTAFAADSSITGSGSSANTDVTGTYYAATPEKVYSVNLTWGSMAFTYQDTEKMWDPANQEYKDKEGSEAYWMCENDANIVTVENRSNAAVNAVLSFSAEESGITGKFYGDSVTASNDLGSATELSNNTLSLADRSQGTPTETDYKKSAYLMVSGGSLDSGDSGVKIGTVTVTISDADATPEP